MVKLKIMVVILHVLYVTIMLLWSIEPKIDWNQLMPTMESKNLLTILIASNSGKMWWEFQICLSSRQPGSRSDGWCTTWPRSTRGRTLSTPMPALTGGNRGWTATYTKPQKNLFTECAIEPIRLLSLISLWSLTNQILIFGILNLNFQSEFQQQVGCRLASSVSYYVCGWETYTPQIHPVIRKVLKMQCWLVGGYCSYYSRNRL